MHAVVKEHRRARSWDPALQETDRALPARPVAPLSPSDVLTLQRTAGNVAVMRAIASARNRGAGLDDAVAYNEGRDFDTATIRSIQLALGVVDDGRITEGLVRALARWQRAHGLRGDGKIGPRTLARLREEGALGSGSGAEAGGSEPAAGSSPAASPPLETSAPEPEGPGLVESIVGTAEEAFRSAREAIGELLGTLTGSAAQGTPEGGAAAEERPTVLPAQAEPVAELTTFMGQDRLSAEEIARARELIAQVPDEEKRGDLYEALQVKSGYASQRDNASVQGGKKIGDVMCNLTSLSMCLSYLGVPNPRPELQYEDALEQIRREEKLPARTMAGGWGGVAKKLGVTVEWISDQDVTAAEEWWVANVRPHLRAGHAVMMSISGHIVRVQAVADEGLVLDDPFGQATLLKGKGWKFGKGANAREEEAEGGRRGEDALQPWDAVSQHTMHWVVAFVR